MGSHVSKYIESENYKSVDLNLVDFSFWGALQLKCHHQKVPDIDYLKHVLSHCYNFSGHTKGSPDQLLKHWPW